MDELRNLITHMRKARTARLDQSKPRRRSRPKREQIARTDNTWVDTEIARIEVKLKEKRKRRSRTGADTAGPSREVRIQPRACRAGTPRADLRSSFRFNTSVFKRHIDMYKFYKNRYERELNDLSETLAADQRNLERIDKEIAEITTSELTEA